MISSEQATDAVHGLLFSDHQLIEALTALSRGRAWFRPGPTKDVVPAAEHVEEVVKLAFACGAMCGAAGLSELGRVCDRIGNLLTVAVRAGSQAKGVKDDLILLVSHARELLAAASRI